MGVIVKRADHSQHDDLRVDDELVGGPVERGPGLEPAEVAAVAQRGPV